MILKLNTFIFPSVENCLTISEEGKEEYLNLMSKTTGDFNKKMLESVSEKIYITDIIESRPDILSKSLYNDETDLDILLMINGISNPFSVEEGMVLISPNKETLSSFRIIPENTNDNQSLALKSLKKSIPEKDINRLVNNGRNIEIKTTNLATKPATTSNNGLIELGTNVSNKKCIDKLSDTQILSERIKEAIRLKV